MKRILLAFLFILSVFTLNAQNYCGSARYDAEVFSNVTVTSNVTYGSNKTWSGSTQNLTMDIYEPTGDTASMRPFIVFAHGGSFIGGDKGNTDQVTLCTRFAKRGYVTASINYRLGMFPINQTNAKAAVWRATQDMKAALRWFRKDAATTNTYKTDTNMYFAGGYSAGCFMAIHLAYLDQSSEVPTDIDTVALGGLEGNSGNPGYSSEIRAVINLAGGIGDSVWIQPGDEPMVTIQGDNDNTVPYCTQMLSISGFPIMVVSGGGSINTRMKNIGINNPIHTFYGKDHDAPVSPAAHMDTTVQLASDFLYKYMGCTPTNTVDYTNTPTCEVVSVNELSSPHIELSIYPVPASGDVAVQCSMFNVQRSTLSVQLLDMAGRIVETLTPAGQEFIISRNGKEAGIYFLKVTSAEGMSQTAKVIWSN